MEAFWLQYTPSAISFEPSATCCQKEINNFIFLETETLCLKHVLVLNKNKFTQEFYGNEKKK